MGRHAGPGGAAGITGTRTDRPAGTDLPAATDLRAGVAARAAALLEARVPFVQATVVRAQHPTSAHAGDTALVAADGGIEGFVGGTCAETSVQVHALEVLQTGQPLLLRIQPGVAATTREEGAVTVANPCLSGGSLEIFLEPRRPAPRLVVVGVTPVARALAAIGAPLGYLVELVPGEAAAPRADDAGLVVASHGRAEEVALEAALRAGVPYVALVASRTRAAAVLAGLDVGDDLRRQVRSPAGMDIGARTAEEIALSILAELISVRARVNDTVIEAQVAIDPVCGMSVAVTDAALQGAYAGATVYFCGAGCRTAFFDDPTRYAAG